ncbi:hypothetical protein J4E83_010785 [Alternaria metachromatica]|uniref:uncharacterized protein n=1 Tax=Alternaria metachromatica TaxID=283354 RepID=UPI0020C490F7|nr:uncharacterized protein J4E83_010785 [Alternaria metachromatica]KAI4605154.1 hypothetical protein J4E83_010785 [Alternaria metachromatica]
MSVSDNSTLDVSHDNDGLGGYAYGTGDLAVSPEEVSPYATTQMVSLEVGPEATRFLVHDSVLSRSEVLAAKSYPLAFVKQSVLLPELDLNTAHTLVHYLYTGKYQSLNTLASSDKVIPEVYKLGAGVYCAAARYKLPGLAELAQNKLKSLDEEMSIFDILTVARDHAFPLLPEDDLWYPSYVEQSLNNAMADDPEPFRKPDFITTVEGNSRLLQLVWKTVMSNYARAPATPVVNNEEASTPTAEVVPELHEPVSGEDDVSVTAPTKKEEVEEPATKPVSAPAPKDVVDEAPVSNDAIVSKPTEEVAPKLEEAQVERTPATLEPFTDELDFKSSKTYQQMGNRKPEQVNTSDAAPETIKTPVHVRSDSVMQVEQPLVTPVDKEMKADDAVQVEATPDRAVADLADLEALATQGKKKKSKKAKKSKQGLVE